MQSPQQRAPTRATTAKITPATKTNAATTGGDGDAGPGAGAGDFAATIMHTWVLRWLLSNTRARGDDSLLRSARARTFLTLDRGDLTLARRDFALARALTLAIALTLARVRRAAAAAWELAFVVGLSTNRLEALAL